MSDSNSPQCSLCQATDHIKDDCPLQEKMVKLTIRDSRSDESSESKVAKVKTEVKTEVSEGKERLLYDGMSDEELLQILTANNLTKRAKKLLSPKAKYLSFMEFQSKYPNLPLEEVLGKLTTDALKDELRPRGCRLGGKKPELVKRLFDQMTNETIHEECKTHAESRFCTKSMYPLVEVQTVYGTLYSCSGCLRKSFKYCSQCGHFLNKGDKIYKSLVNGEVCQHDWSTSDLWDWR